MVVVPLQNHRTTLRIFVGAVTSLGEVAVEAEGLQRSRLPEEAEEALVAPLEQAGVGEEERRQARSEPQAVLPQQQEQWEPAAQAAETEVQGHWASPWVRRH